MTNNCEETVGCAIIGGVVFCIGVVILILSQWCYNEDYANDEKNNILSKWHQGKCPVDGRPWVMYDDTNYKKERVYSCGEHYLTVHDPWIDDFNFEWHKILSEVKASSKPEKEN